MHGGHLRPGFQVRSHPYLAGKEGRRHPRGPGHRQHHCQDGSRHRRRYAHHRRSRGQVSQARLPCHEHRDAGEPHHPGQHRHTGKVRLHGHPLRERRAGLQGRGQRTPAERGSPAGLHLPRHRKAEGPRRPAHCRHGRPHPRAAGPCALPDQPLHRQDGLCRGPCRCDAGCRSHPHPRPDGPAAGAVHRGCPHHDSPADVRGRDQPLRRDGRSGHGRCRGRLPPRRRGRRQDQEEGRRPLHRRGADARHPRHHRPQKEGPVPLRLLDGDAGHAGQLLGQAREKEPRHGGGQQSEGRRCRVWRGYQCCHLHHAGRRPRAAPDEQG